MLESLLKDKQGQQHFDQYVRTLTLFFKNPGKSIHENKNFWERFMIM